MTYSKFYNNVYTEPDVVAQAFNPSTWDTEAGGAL